MIKFKVSFLSDYVYDREKDELIILRSSSRLLSLLSFMFAFIISFAILLDGVSWGDIMPMQIIFLAYSLGQKTFNKAIEIFGNINTGKNGTFK